MDKSDLIAKYATIEESRKILRPNRQAFSKPVYVKRLEENNLSSCTQTSPLDLMFPKIPQKGIEIHKETSTQTSKTILELARKEQLNLSSDSLEKNSPRSCDFKSFPQEISKLTSFHATNNPFSITKQRSAFHNKSTNDLLNLNKHEYNGFKHLHKYTISQEEAYHQTINPDATKFDSDESKTGRDNKLEYDIRNHHLLKREMPITVNLIEGKSNTTTKQINSPLVNKFLSKNHNRQYKRDQRFHSKSCIEPKADISALPTEIIVEQIHLLQKNMASIDINRKICKKLPRASSKYFVCQSRRSNSFMNPTLSSTIKSQLSQVQTIKNLAPDHRRGRSLSPKLQKVDCHQEFGDVKANDQVYQNPPDISSRGDINQEETCDDVSVDNSFSSGNFDPLFVIVNKIKSQDWNVALKGLADFADYSKSTDLSNIMPQTSLVSQKVLQLCRSPRSHVSRTACQLAGVFFETIKDTRRPEFDDLVNLLLNKTADSNKFLRQDANLSLDTMVQNIPTMHSVRALTAKGPFHKNPLVRCAAARLLICAAVIAGPSELLNSSCHENSRRKIIGSLIVFLEDKNVDTRRYAERLFNVLMTDPVALDMCLRKVMYKEDLETLYTTLYKRKRH